MSIEVTVPQIGESVATVFIARWLKAPGESVAAGEGLVELDSDKASMEVPAPAGGVLSETLAEEGDEVPIGAGGGAPAAGRAVAFRAGGEERSISGVMRVCVCVCVCVCVLVT